MQNDAEDQMVDSGIKESSKWNSTVGFGKWYYKYILPPQVMYGIPGDINEGKSSFASILYSHPSIELKLHMESSNTMGWLSI